MAGTTEAVWYRPFLTRDRLTDDTYVDALDECLYHLVALSPPTFFATVVPYRWQATQFAVNDVLRDAETC